MGSHLLSTISTNCRRSVRRYLKCVLSKRLILITGCQRSGTTLLFLMLDAHPRIDGSDESEVGYRLPDARHLLKNTLAGRLTCWKQPMHSAAVDTFHQVYPHVKTVWLIRNPLKVVSSMRTLQLDDWEDNWLGMWAGNEMEQLSRLHSSASEWKDLSRVELGARIWRLNCECMLKARQKGINTNILKFEELLKNTKVELKKLCKKLQIKYKRQIIKYHSLSRNQGRVLAGGTRADEKLDPSRRKNGISLSDEEKQKVLAECMPWVEKFGYV